MTTIEIIGIIAFFSLVSVIIDAKMNKHIIKGEKAKYKKTAAALMVISWALITWFAIGLKWIAIPVFLVPFIIRYALFDIILNKLMGWKWNFTGTTSQIDRLKIPFWVRFAIAGGLIVLLSFVARSQDTVCFSINALQNETTINGKIAYYLNKIQWKESDKNPEYMAKLTNLTTLGNIDTFAWLPTGEVFIYENAYRKLVHPFISQGFDVSLFATVIISDKDFTEQTNLKITFKKL